MKILKYSLLISAVAVASGCQTSDTQDAVSTMKSEASDKVEMVQNEIKNHQLFEIHKDGRMIVASAEDGKILEERKVPAPAWDGLAVAEGKLFLTTFDGQVVCLGE